MTTLTNEELILLEQGIAARRVLSDPTIADAINALSDEITNDLLSTTPDQKDERENLYQAHHALHRLVMLLRTREAVARDIEAKANASKDGDEQEMDFS